MTNSRENWDFKRYIEEIISLSEITDVPGIEEARTALINEAWLKFADECSALGLTGSNVNQLN